MARVFICFALLSLSGAVFSEGLASSFGKAKKLSEKHENLPEAECYTNCTFLKEYEEIGSSIMRNCFKNIEDKDIKSFELVIALNQEGAVISNWYQPETNVGSCLSKGLTNKNFSKPPFSPFYTLIEMNFG